MQWHRVFPSTRDPRYRDRYEPQAAKNEIIYIMGIIAIIDIISIMNITSIIDIISLSLYPGAAGAKKTA